MDTTQLSKTGIKRSCWGYTFDWTDYHRSADELRPLIFTYDSLADECLQRLDGISSPSKNISRQDSGSSEGAKTKPPRRDLYSLLRDHSCDDPKLTELWAQINTIPEWVDWEQIKRGQDVFYRYGLPILNVLNFESLLGGMGSGRVVETLARTGGFSADVARRRMLETLQHVLQVTDSVESLKPGGPGHISSVRVRLLHATVRQRILSLTRQKSEYYEVEKFGIPVNDLDCIATINTFSTSVIWLGLPRQGIWLRDQEVDDYIALWRLIGYYMGTPTEPFSTRARSRATMESLLVSEIEPTEIGKVLAMNIILSLENTAPSYASKGFMEAMTRQLNGQELSDALGIPRPNVYYQALVYGYCFFVMVISYTIPLVSLADQYFIAVRRKQYYDIITNKEGLGRETLFEFKYVPFLTRTTRLGKRRVSTTSKPGIEYLAHIGIFGATIVATMLGYGMISGLRLLDLNRLLLQVKV
ncbi:hypothetical protein ASPWEDRAFT_114436 [Aspergillus wentii DTO 134E9]|uniref:ER-bound oxygenase mpaB/mpaB'/Rubber oxygenase catalytic domain-containing protein n=1 Tax=Aspergillus wentii DTO 134E9 TaxID=1073089 RepID=A0A1L9RD20_ASPWE|nr:uncharacterized protein ASPWEDRAFT_114436 [Aspergillus wentii DTO 134E9]OJJ32811.1 hypothetical protein ASPWEDRAFT_114436 [Aspergillus wentii DTO 134E9]